MKTHHFLFAALLSLSISPSNGIILEPTSSIFVSTSTIGPFEARGSDVSITFNYSSSSNQNFVASYFGVGLRSGNYTSTQSSKAINLIANTNYKITYNLPISNYLSNKGMYIYIKFFNYSTGKVLFEKEICLYPSSHSSINPNNYKQQPYISNTVAFSFISSLATEITEYFDFKELLDYVDVDNYYKFSFGNSKFTYDAMRKISYGKIELIFDDVNTCFPFYKKEQDGLIHIPLKLKTSFKNISFSFSKGFYVNPVTLEMSDSYREGFVLTNDFYFPINKREYVDGYIFTIDAQDVGLDKINFKYDMKLDISREYVGTQYSSDAYIKGGIRS